MLILSGILLGLFVLLFLGSWLNNRYGNKNKERGNEASPVKIPLDCCGAHENCEFEQMLQRPDEIVYFDDEELDRFKGILPDRYDDSQIEEFRDVLYTLHAEDIRKWLLSIERRQIQLPWCSDRKLSGLLPNTGWRVKLYSSKNRSSFSILIRPRA